MHMRRVLNDEWAPLGVRNSLDASTQNGLHGFDAHHAMNREHGYGVARCNVFELSYVHGGWVLEERDT
jgi:hypothetical protein